MGPAILARALGGRPVRGQDPRQRAGVHGQAAPALPAVRRRGPRGRARRARRVAPHRREPVGRDGRPVAARPHPARAAGRRRGALRPARAGRPRGPGRARAAADAARRRSAPRSAATGSSFDRDVREAVAALDTVEPGDRLVVFVGKLIASKGVELLLAAWPLVLAREPRARLVIVGFGAFRTGLERLAAQLAAGDLAAAARDARRGRARAARSSRRSSCARTPTPTAPRGSTAWRSPGRLDHAELADLLPAAEAMAVTSTFPEAFGMVAAEAAACGALPVVANHSGLGEVARTLARRPSRRGARRGSPSRSGRTPWPSSRTRCRAGSRRPRTSARRTREAIVEVTRARYSWDGVARTVIAAAQGELADLPEPRVSARRRSRARSLRSTTAKAVTAVESESVSVIRPVEITAAGHAEVDQRVEGGVDLAAAVGRGGEVELGLARRGTRCRGRCRRAGRPRAGRAASGWGRRARARAGRRRAGAARRPACARGRRSGGAPRSGPTQESRASSALIAPSSARFEVSSRSAA